MLDPENIPYNEVNGMINEFNGRNEEYVDIVFRILDNIDEQLKSKNFKIRGLEWNKYNEWRLLLPFVMKSINYPVFSNRFINSCRESYEHYLDSMENSEIELKSAEFGISITYDREINQFKVPIFEFTKYCSRISGFEYRLTFQSFYGGDVIIGKNAVIKMLREYFAVQLREETSAIDPDRARELFLPFSDRIEEIRSILKEQSKSTDLGGVDSSCFPPCIIHFLNDIKGGVNLPHLARFTVVSFLNNIGMNEQGIIESFGTVPDFSKKVTEYQVRHIIGEISGTKYSPPKCVTLRSNHLCYWDNDELCHKEFMTHPLTYYKMKKKAKK